MAQFTFANTEDKVLKISTPKYLPPFSFIGKDNKPHGILIDFWKKYANNENIKVEFLFSEWKDTLIDIQNSKADFHSGLFTSKEREIIFDFTDELPIALSANLFVSKDLSVSDFNDLKNTPVGTVSGSYEESFLKNNYPHLTLIIYTNYLDMVEAATNTEISAFVADYPIGKYHLNNLKKPEQFYATVTLYTKHLRSIVKKGNIKLANEISSGISRIDEDDINQLLNKWYISVKVTPKWFVPTLVSFVVLVVCTIFIMYIFILKKQVKSRTRELELLAKTDNLTKCNNRQSIDEIFAKEIFRRKRYSNPLSIILIDIDDFKKINDTFGHLVGDKTIILIAELLKNNIRQSDSLGRWGGEEFLIICPETNLSEAEVLANKLCQQIGLLDFPHEEQCTASFGVTTSRKKDKEEDAFIRADKALYLAKEEGKNRVKSL